MCSSDFLELNKLKLFQDLSKNVPKSISKPCNVLASKDDVVYAWDFVRNCVLTVNLKAARGADGDKVDYQTLWGHINFTPEFLLVNDTNTLLIIGATTAVAVLELPTRFPPYGAFLHNTKEVHCQTHILDEHLFAWSNVTKVRHVKFHPGSQKNNHILILSSDNTLRLYSISNSNVTYLEKFSVGETPMGVFPGTKTTYLDAFGEVGVSFDFGQPEIDEKNIVFWPIYLLRRDGSIFHIKMSLDNKFSSEIVEIKKNLANESLIEEACAILCQNTTPEIICVANSNGTVYHSILMASSGEKTKELFCRERIELELGLQADEGTEYTCPIYFHKDVSRSGRYFASHAAGIHCITIPWARKLNNFATSPETNNNFAEIFSINSKAEYLLCTKMSNTSNINQVIGCCLYFSPLSVIALLGDASIVSLAIINVEIGEELANLSISTTEDVSSSRKLRGIAAENIEAALSLSQMPVLKLGAQQERNLTQRELYDLAKMALDKLRQRMAMLTIREDIARRAKALALIQEQQRRECERMEGERQELHDRLMASAERYEEIVERQAVLSKRCETLVALVPQKRAEPSDAQLEFFQQIEGFKAKVDQHQAMMEKLRTRTNYQRLQIQNWKHNQTVKMRGLKEEHSMTIKSNLMQMSEKIAQLVKEVNEYNSYLNLA